MGELDSKLIEDLAEIEHERWADWQSHLHGKAEEQEDGSLLLPRKLVERWEHQIETEYKDLSEEDKQKDRDQVDRYLPLVMNMTAAEEFSMALMAERVAARVAARRRPTMEQQLEWLNAPKKPKKPLGWRLFGCDIVEEGGEFVVYKNNVEVGRAKDRREAQEVARANW